MKANELMIGDWVKVSIDFEEPPFQIGVISWDEVTQDSGAELSFNISDLEPIPLTDEILKANWFEIPKHMYMYEMVYQGMKICFCDFQFKVYESALFNSALISEMRPINNYKYIHELQHALRLCGLNELADNFKIN